MTRRCGDCQLCCTLPPVPPLEKAANERCKYARFGKGCTIYDRRPRPCALWTCMWMAEPELTRDMRRPDRAHYCIDPSLDFIRRVFDDGRPDARDPVIQVWCDPRYPDAHRDPALRLYLETKAMPAIIRFGAARGIVIVPPQINDQGRWIEIESAITGPEHSTAEIVEVMAESGLAYAVVQE